MQSARWKPAAGGDAQRGADSSRVGFRQMLQQWGDVLCCPPWASLAGPSRSAYGHQRVLDLLKATAIWQYPFSL